MLKTTLTHRQQEKFTTQEEGDTSIPADVTEHSSMRIAALEHMVEELKQANDALASEMDEMGGDAAQVMSGPGRGSIAALKDSLVHERQRVLDITEELETTRGELAALEKKVESLDEELFRLKGEVGTGRHVPPGIRILEMVDNPAAKWFGKREEDVQRLKKENEALRSMMGDGVAASTRPTDGVITDGLVPKETLDVLIQEKSELEMTIKEKEKRLLRLQQVCSRLYFEMPLKCIPADIFPQSGRIQDHCNLPIRMEVPLPAKWRCATHLRI